MVMAQAPATDPGLLLANLISRVILAFLGILLCWVPVRILVRNGEFSAVVLIIDVAIMNLITILNSIIWHNDDWDTWWDGAGLCDAEVYLSGPLQTIYAASIFTILYHLTQQLKLTRTWRLDHDEKTRRNMIQAAIIFPIPCVQLVFTYFDLAQRYIVGTLIGCSAVYDNSWPKNLVYDAPPAVFAVLSVPYAVLLWRRYRVIANDAQGILKSNSEVSIRANRTRRRLYNMSLSILVIYLPVMLYYLTYNIKDTLLSYKTYDYERIRWSASPYPWETILFVPSWIIPTPVMNQPWIPIATTVAIVAFFGMTVEAKQTYRQYTDFLGLGTCMRKFKRSQNQDHAHPVDSSGGTQHSGKDLLPNSKKHTIMNPINPDRDMVLPTIERPDEVQTPSCRAFSPRPTAVNQHSENQHSIHIASSPPIIPPRYSSLRFSFAFRTPTLQSIFKDSIRVPSLPRSQNATSSASGASNKTTGNLTQFERQDSIPMLPLHTFTRLGEQADADSPRSLDSFLARDVRDAEVSSMGFSATPDYQSFRPGNRLQIRIPIVQYPAPASKAAFHGKGRARRDYTHGSQQYPLPSTACSGLIARRDYTHLLDGDCFPREQTLASLPTASSDSTGDGVRGDMGVTK